VFTRGDTTIVPTAGLHGANHVEVRDSGATLRQQTQSTLKLNKRLCEGRQKSFSKHDASRLRRRCRWN
jgi:hypothetical protein